MSRIKFTFENKQQEQLSGLLEMPDKPVTANQFAIFAHCFTCGKDIAAATRISRALAQKGIAVLRFDFTGLGNSDGDFANTNFSSNVADLLAAAAALKTRYQAPTLLIGHSLGGAAVLSAAEQLPSVRAIATIAAPATASHVQHLFVDHHESIMEDGLASVRLGVRAFTIKKQLLEDLKQHAAPDHIRNLDAALLVFHSPEDDTVPISEAARIYRQARHPKSFISLHDADHLLTRKEDAQYVAETLTAWAGRYLDSETVQAERSYGTAPEVAKDSVVVSELDQKFLRGLYSHNHQCIADEPLSAGGTDLGPNPYELLLMSLGACTSMTLRMYANHKQLRLTDISVELRHQRDYLRDCKECETPGHKVERIIRKITLTGDLTEAQRKRLLQIADLCPVHRTLESILEVETEEGD